MIIWRKIQLCMVWRSRKVNSSLCILDFKSKTFLNYNFFSEHSVPVNVDAMNTDYMNRSQEVWDSIEQDRWLYNLDNEEGILPNFKSKKRSEDS